jgi:hypothetical protein
MSVSIIAKWSKFAQYAGELSSFALKRRSAGLMAV